MAADEPWRAWELYSQNAVDSLGVASEVSNKIVADDELRRALVYAVLAVAAAIAHYPDGWGEPERRTE